MSNQESYHLHEDIFGRKSLSSDTEKEQEAELKDKLVELGRDFATKTTAHGWGRVSRARAKTIKLIWLAVTLIALVACMVHISLLTTQYLHFYSEVKWKVSLSEIHFPSVTVCNIQPLSEAAAMKQLRDPNSQFSQWYNITQNMDIFQEAANFFNKSEEFEILQNRMKQPIGYFENIGNESITVGHQQNDFILGCTYGQFNCDTMANFSFFQSSTYFNCYTFNGGKSSNALTSKSSGPHNGLSMILYLENDSGNVRMDNTYHTLSNVGNAAGARLVVHPPGTRPSPVDMGIDIPPGHSANVGLSVLNFRRLDHPYGQCAKTGEKDNENYVYSSHSCMLLCQQDYVIDRCQCVSSVLPISSTQKELKLIYCSQWDVEDPKDLPKYWDRIFCENEALQNFTMDTELKESCQCDPLCNEYTYEYCMSYASWPLEYAQSDFFTKYVLQNDDKEQLRAYQNLAKFNISELIERGMIYKNFLRVNVYFRSMSIEEYDEKKAYELPNLFSDIGGTCGLWIGMSIITWCEFIELFTNFIMKVYHHFSPPATKENIN